MDTWFVLTAIKVIAVVAIAGGWFMFNMAVDQRYDCPTLQKIAKWGNAILLVVLFAVIIKYDLWC